MSRHSLRERIETAFARQLFALPLPWIRAMVGAPIVRDGQTLDVQAQLALGAAKIAGKRQPYDVPIPEARREMDISGTQLSESPQGIEVSERTLGGRTVRIYRPADARSPGPAVMFFHGGGFALGSLDSHDGCCRALARDARCVVLSVDYRLAPEHPFPAAVDDATGAFRAAVAEAATLGIDPARIAVAGDSAGGNLAAVVSLDTRTDAVRPCFQLLIYPGLDQTMSFPSLDLFAEGFLLEKKSIAYYVNTYLAGHDPRDPRASPWFAMDLKGLPPALVITAGFDPLRDEGDAYVKRLREAGVPVTHHQRTSLFHGFWNTTGSIHAAREAFDDAVNVLRGALG